MPMENSLFRQLTEAVKSARAEVQAEMVEVIKETAGKKKEWLPAAWYLERTNPDGFGRRERHDVHIEKKEFNIVRVEIVRPESHILPSVDAEVKELTEGED